MMINMMIMMKNNANVLAEIILYFVFLSLETFFSYWIFEG